MDIDAPAVIDDFEFQIHWSFDPVSDFIPIVDSNEDIVVIDGATGPLSHNHDLKQYDFNKDRYYKVLVIEKADPLHQLFSETVKIGTLRDGIHEVMQYSESLLYDHYIGEPCYILKRKSTGERCGECWSETRRQRTKTHCDTCNGTGFVDGYYDPISIQISFESDKRMSDSQQKFEDVFDKQKGRISNYPLVRPKDLIINRDDGKRYVITHIETTKIPKLRDNENNLSRQNYILSQIIFMSELNPDDNEYTLDFDSILNRGSVADPSLSMEPSGDHFETVEVIKVVSDNTFFIDWTMDIEPPGVIDDYEFKIYWSFDPISDFELMVDDNDDPVIIDGAVGPLSFTHDHKQYDFNKDRYYKIMAIEKANPGNTFYSETVYIGMFSDGLHEVMVYNEGLLNTTYNGEPCKIFKRKSTGERCTECWSPTRRQRTKTHCDTCDGTGFVDGYYEPIDVQVSFDSDPRKSDSQKEWEHVFDTKRARLTNFPLLRPKDLIVNCDDAKRYVVTHVETTKLPKVSREVNNLSKQNYIVSQLLTLEELNPDDNEYSVDW